MRETRNLPSIAAARFPAIKHGIQQPTTRKQASKASHVQTQSRFFIIIDLVVMGEIDDFEPQGKLLMQPSHISHPMLYMEPEQFGTLRDSSRPPLHQDENKLDIFDGADRPISPRTTPAHRQIPVTSGDTRPKSPSTSATATDNKVQPPSNGGKAPKPHQGKNWNQPAPTQLELSPQVATAVRGSVGKFPAETGGMLGGKRKNGRVTHFHFDKWAQRSGSTYSPDTNTMNQLLSGNWDLHGVEFLGFVHSHPQGVIHPSQGDLIYARRILTALPSLPYLLMPIVQPQNGHQKCHIYGYAVSRIEDTFEGHHVGDPLPQHGVRLHTLELRQSPTDDKENKDSKPDDFKENDKASEPIHIWVLLWMVCVALLVVNLYPSRRSDRTLPSGRFNHTETQLSADEQNRGGDEQNYGGNINANTESKTDDPAFARVRDAYDLGLLSQSRVVSVGAGGAAAFIEDLARAGVGEQVLIDADTVSLTNIGTQQVYRSDLGRPKVKIIAGRLSDINPIALVVPRQNWLDDISDKEMERLLFAPGCELDPTSSRTQPPKQVLLCGLTDNFEAQARINRLALQFGVPSLCAQVYFEGRGAEVSFTAPGITPACHRCALASRYAAYLKGGFQNDVTSHGTPIFATTRLNALKGFVSLAILHRNSAHSRWSGLAKRIGDRNLVMLRLDPDISQTLGLSVFDRVLGSSAENSVLFDEALWRPQKPDNPANGYPQCPDCGGSGDLRDAIGTFDDTRPMRP